MDEWHVSDSEEDYGSAEENSGERHDRLSELPDSLICEILSLLDIRDAVRTTLLSLRWKNLWSTIPCLDFFEQTPDIISSILSQWKGPKILRFSLSFPSIIATPSSVIDSWLLFAIEKQVEELYLDLSDWRDINGDEQDFYCLPQPLYSCSWITRLTVMYSKLRIEGNVQWNQLKGLKLIYAVVDGLSGDALNQILLGAPRLEKLVLTISGISNNEELNIRSTSLKMLKIDAGFFRGEAPVLRIWAPNLLTLDIEASRLCLLDVSSLTNAILCLDVGYEATQLEIFNHVFRSIRHVENLTLLSYGFIEMLVRFKEKGMVMPLLDSKILKLEYTDAIEVLDLVGMMFPKLERLIVDQGYRHQFMWVATRFDTVATRSAMVDALASAKTTFLHLKTFEATWGMSDPSIILAIQILLENAPILEKMVIRLRLHTSHIETFVLAREKVLSMPRRSPTAQVIISLVDF